MQLTRAAALLGMVSAGLVLAAPAAQAGPVRVSFEDGRLTVVGNDADNQVAITRLASSVSVVVDGQKVKLRPRPKPDTLNSIKVKGKGGNDILVLVEQAGPLPDASLQGGLGDDRLVGGSGATRLIGKAGNDVLIGGAGPTYMDSGDGNDQLSGGAGPTTMMAGAGNDSLTGGSGNASMGGGDGDDSLTGGSGITSMAGGPGVDHLTSGSGSTSMAGDDGNDVLKATNTASMTGGAGDDNLTGGTGFTSMSGETGSDQLTAGSGPTTMAGGDGNDALTAGAATGEMVGGLGDDTYAIDADVVSGSLHLTEASGAGDDLVTFAATTTTGAAFDASMTAQQQVTPALAATLSSGSAIERLSGGDMDDVLTGNSLANTLTGGQGQDTFGHHGAGDAIDTVTDMASAQGDQVLFTTGGALSADQLTLNLIATQLRDVATFTFGFNFTAPVLNGSSFYVYGEADTAPVGQLITFNGVGGFGQGSNVDSLITSYATSGSTIGGAGGKDRIVDLSSNGNSLIGRDGVDVLLGGNGADTLQGDRGFAPGVADTYTGGAGVDTFRFGEAFGGGALETFGADTISDFGDGADTVDLFTGLSVHSGLGTATVTIWDGATDFGTITASNGHLWIAGDFT